MVGRGAASWGGARAAVGGCCASGSELRPGGRRSETSFVERGRGIVSVGWSSLLQLAVDALEFGDVCKKWVRTSASSAAKASRHVSVAQR